MTILTKRTTVIFDHQSQYITYEEWIDLITICLTPLIAHIIAGVPSPTVLQLKPPRWYDRIGHFNPTSILWRYCAILDRRIRAKSWGAMTMAASNAVFWTGQGWDGSENMIWKSITYCIRRPSKAHIDFMSATAAKTLITGLQGFSALYAILWGTFNMTGYKYATKVSISYVFVPLAVLGLMRLPIAFWLSEDYNFANINIMDNKSTGIEMETLSSKHPIVRTRSSLTESLLESELSTLPREGEDEIFYPIKSWRGRLAWIIFICLLSCLWLVSIYYIVPWHGKNTTTNLFMDVFTTTTLLINILYLICLSTTILAMLIYLWKGKSTTTIIPCVGATWYKLYTGFLLLIVIGIMVVAGLETRKTSCGTFTTYPPSYDGLLCPT